MNVINLTPHPIHLIGENDDLLAVWESQGVARVASRSSFIASIEAVSNSGSSVEIPLWESNFGEIEGLPEQRPDTILIVSGLVQGASNRQDLFVPDDLVRDSRGGILGCRRLRWNS